MTAGRPSIALAAALVLAGCTVLAGCVAERTGSLAAAFPPEPRRPEIAPSADAEHAALVRALGGAYEAPALAEYLTGIVDRLARAASGRDAVFAVTLLDSPTLNAFALPSGRLYLTRGLLALANDEAEIAAAISHEIAHVRLKHAEKREEARAKLLLANGAGEGSGDGPGRAAAAGAKPARSVTRFSREQEFEADAESVRLLAAAGYDPGAAARILRSLGRRQAAEAAASPGAASGPAPTHPATAVRAMLAAREGQSAGVAGPTHRERYLQAIDGLAYGDNPADGIVRGGRFLHPRLGIRLDAPPGFTLSNTPRAVVGLKGDGRARLVFDAVEDGGDDLPGLLVASWSEPLDEGSRTTTLVAGREVALATAQGRDWLFRLAALRVGRTVYRLIMAGDAADPAFERDFTAAIEGVAPIGPGDVVALRPQRVVVVRARSGETVQDLSSRMRTPNPAETFLALNGLAPRDRLVPGRAYKLVTD